MRLTEVLQLQSWRFDQWWQSSYLGWNPETKNENNVDDNDDDFDAKDDDVDASQSSVQCSVSDHKLHSRVHHEVAVSDSDTEVEVFVDTALVVTSQHAGSCLSFGFTLLETGSFSLGLQLIIVHCPVIKRNNYSFWISSFGVWCT